jgi:hypothetical protein
MCDAIVKIGIRLEVGLWIEKSLSWDVQLELLIGCVGDRQQTGFCRGQFSREASILITKLSNPSNCLLCTDNMLHLICRERSIRSDVLSIHLLPVTMQN